MLGRTLRQSVLRASFYTARKTAIPATYRLFSTGLTTKQEAEAIKPTEGKLKR